MNLAVPSRSPQPLLPMPTVSVETDARIAVARFGPLVHGDSQALERQTELLAPAKLALSTNGDCELRAEVLRVNGLIGTEGTDASKLALGALDRGRAWLTGVASGPPAQDNAPDAELAEAIDELPPAWAWESAEGGGFRVHATAFGESVRLSVHAVAGGAQVMARSTLKPDADAGPALTHFCLDTNRRLRLARIGLARRDGDPGSSASAGTMLAVTWDAVTPPGIELSNVLPATVEAVVRAHAASRRSLLALCHDAVARLYLDARRAAPRRRRHVSCVSTQEETNGKETLWTR